MNDWKLMSAIAAVCLCVAGCPGDEPDHVGTDAGGDVDEADASDDVKDNVGEDANGHHGENDDERPSGMVAEVYDGEPLDVDEERIETARQEFRDLDKSELEEGFSPEELYGVFNEFALTHFGPENQPLIEEYTGELLDFVPDGEWMYVSRNSAAVAFQTTLPVRGYVEYGSDESQLDEETEESERYFFNQLHHLTGLEPDTEYHYRLVARGDDGETIASHTRSFTTEAGSDWTDVPGELDGPPYRLDESGTTYVLTEDITAERTALIVEGGTTDVTIDLNGHTITHADSEVDGADGTASDSASGVFARSSSISGIEIVNGHITEGRPGNLGGNYNGGLNAVYLGGLTDAEIAGLSMSYNAAETQGMHLRYLDGRLRIHHNSIVDRGFEVRDRHGIGGGRAIYLVADDPEEGEVHDFSIEHNLLARTRQMGFSSAPVVRQNEVYIDSWSTNSFGLHPESNGEMVGNKLFLTGYNPYGFGWAGSDLLVEDNLVQMEGVATGERRYFEDWGEMDAMAAFRITNYGDGGDERNDLVYRDNVVVGRARGGGIMRGTMFYSDYTIEDTSFENGFVHVVADDDDSLDTSAVVGQGVFSTRDEGHLPVYYRDGEFASNVANVRFGDSYGRGDNHVFVNPTFRRVGDHPEYATFVFDNGFYSEHHEIIDPVFEGGAAYDDVWWRRTGSVSHYTISWTLTVQAAASEEVTIEDVDGREVFAGTIGEDGELEVPLSAVTIRPEDFEEGDTFEVNDSRSHQEIWHTPHQVTVGDDMETVEMEEARSVSF